MPILILVALERNLSVCISNNLLWRVAAATAAALGLSPGVTKQKQRFSNLTAQ